MKRGHHVDSVFKAIKRLSDMDGLDIGIHLIFGFNGETDADILAAKHTNPPLSGVKLHNLHVYKYTKLHEYYPDGSFVRTAWKHTPKK